MRLWSLDSTRTLMRLRLILPGTSQINQKCLCNTMFNSSFRDRFRSVRVLTQTNSWCMSMCIWAQTWLSIRSSKIFLWWLQVQLSLHSSHQSLMALGMVQRHSSGSISLATYFSALRLACSGVHSKHFNLSLLCRCWWLRCPLTSY